MDAVDRLKVLNQDVAKRQDESLESIKTLSQTVATINSDILNTINSLQMLGNRQFAENRVLEDDSLIGPTSKSPQQATDLTGVPANHSSGGYITNDVDKELTLQSILLRALELLPVEESEDDDVKDSGDDTSPSERELGHADARQDVGEAIKAEEPVNNPEASVSNLKPALKCGRVADILKRYSLYDDDEDDEEEEDD